MLNNKSLLCAALIAAAAVVTPAHAAKKPGTGPGGTIEFSGKVLADSCQVAINGGTIVTLPTVMTDDFTAAGDTAGDTSFTVALTSCDKNTTTATMDFSGPNSNIDASTGELVNAVTDGSDVRIRLLDASNQQINLASGTADGPEIAIGSDGEGSTSLTAQYVATSATPSPGLVSTSVNFTLTYQ